ncbi:MAG: chlororespiratory reduction protein 7 [Sphaerospermopsis sp. SIO1G2]|nr:chlororespiratory reduction protein 7 [Sphaerospermopsis sp. SIO1G1]NET70524.1 chlororespiratory reduction protein 7 [Sphaerospermopsis sp. SIO1G2]
MPHSLMYEEDNFVVLETNQPEQFLTAAELLEKLVKTLAGIPFDDLPQDIKKFASVTEQAQHLIDTGCELDMGPGKYLHWYAVRLER